MNISHEKRTQLADALATMSSMFKVRWDNEDPQITIERLDKPAHCCDIETEEVKDKPWFHEVKRYLEAQEYPKGASVNDKKFLRSSLQILHQQRYSLQA